MDTKSFHFKVQIFICLVMLALALLGLIIMYFHPEGYWPYSRIMALLYAILSIALYFYTHKRSEEYLITFWHQLLHWLGLLLAILVLSVYIRTGILSPIQAGLVNLVLLAFTIFLAGVYVNSFFMVIGTVLGIFSVVAAYVQAYLLVFMIPVILIAAGLIFILLHQQHKANNEE